jgi:hypothetical protein
MITFVAFVLFAAACVLLARSLERANYEFVPSRQRIVSPRERHAVSGLSLRGTSVPDVFGQPLR